MLHIAKRGFNRGVKMTVTLPIWYIIAAGLPFYIMGAATVLIGNWRLKYNIVIHDEKKEDMPVLPSQALTEKQQIIEKIQKLEPELIDNSWVIPPWEQVSKPQTPEEVAPLYVSDKPPKEKKPRKKKRIIKTRG
jgi:hypothetical protein